MADLPSKDALFEVSDSTDWLDTPLAGLAAIEAALRCRVCKDFWTTPMTTSCGHTFCSACIRRCLANDGQCPVCRRSDQEIKLRGSSNMEEAVEAFQRVRKGTLDFARGHRAIDAATSPKRKLAEAEFGDAEGQQRKKTRSSTRMATRSVNQQVNVLDSDTDDTSYEPDDGLVSCPICSSRMKMEKINAHLDTHTEEPQRTSAPPKFSQPTTFRKPTLKPERLPTLSYSLYKETQLRKKLGELGISTTGSRQLLEKRHKEWVTLWNSNCDSSRPRTKAELLHDLDVWERAQGGRAVSSNHGQNSSHIASKNFDSAGWASKHGPSFNELIEAARRNAKPNSAETEGPSSESTGVGKDGAVQHNPSGTKEDSLQNSDTFHNCSQDGGPGYPENRTNPRDGQQGNANVSFSESTLSPRKKPTFVEDVALESTPDISAGREQTL